MIMNWLWSWKRTDPLQDHAPLLPVTPTALRASGYGMLQLGELGTWERDPPLMRAEVHKHGVVFHAKYDAEPVRIVRHLIVDGERLGRARRSRGVERAAGQAAPGRNTRCLHGHHHAPCPYRQASRRWSWRRLVHGARQASQN
jgi:hypothetical protein